MNVTFYQNSSDPLVANKTISAIGSANCEVKHERGVLEPSVIISKQAAGDFANINYMYISGLHRYYYAKVAELPAGMLEITGNVDVLMSYNSGIKNITCTIIRQENLYNKYYQDTMCPVRATKTLTYKTVGTLPNVKTNIITVDGGI